MINVAICDDNIEFIKLLSTNVSHQLRLRNLNFDITNFTNTDTLLEHMKTNTFDFIFMDIDFSNEKKNGIEISKKINYFYPNTFIIFITGYPDYFIDVYNADHVFLIIKDDIFNLLPKALDVALSKINKSDDNNIIQVKRRNEVLNLPKSSIIYMENVLRQIKIHCIDQDILLYAKFSDYENDLDPNTFVQCHRSFVVNTNYIKKFSKAEIELIDGQLIPVGRNYKDRVVSTLFKKK